MRALLAALRILAVLCACVAAPSALAKGPAPASDTPQVDVLTWEGAIQPISAEVIKQAIGRAEREKREALIIRLDTPGGLDTAMRDIIKRILISEVPVVVYVAPSGGRAASAGTFIAMAAHVAAMSPGTSIGAATPIQVGGGDVGKDLARKVKNDAVSYIRSLASQRGRNADWAEKAVREGGSLGETDALRMKVVDLVARDVDELLTLLDGRRVTVLGETRVLHTKGAGRHRLHSLHPRVLRAPVRALEPRRDPPRRGRRDLPPTRVPRVPGPPREPHGGVSHRLRDGASGHRGEGS
jgi:membrane-bound ClpP family serine protease